MAKIRLFFQICPKNALWKSTSEKQFLIRIPILHRMQLHRQYLLWKFQANRSFVAEVSELKLPKKQPNFVKNYHFWDRLSVFQESLKVDIFKTNWQTRHGYKFDLSLGEVEGSLSCISLHENGKPCKITKKNAFYYPQKGCSSGTFEKG